MIAARPPFGPGDIAKIVVHGSQATVDHVGWPYRPQGLTSAQMNLPFCVATLLLEGDVFVDQFSDAAVDRPARAWRSPQKVEVVHDPAITARGAKFRHMVRVEVHFSDGTRSNETVEAPRGSEASSPARPTLWKFKKLATHTVSGAKADEVVNLVLGAEKLKRAEQIAEALAA